MLGAEVDDQFVGYAFVTVGPGYSSCNSGERHAHLETLAVAPSIRGQGVGEQLLGAMRQEVDTGVVKEDRALRGVRERRSTSLLRAPRLPPCRGRVRRKDAESTCSTEPDRPMSSAPGCGPTEKTTTRERTNP